jgi:hypothetical protein
MQKVLEHFRDGTDKRLDNIKDFTSRSSASAELGYRRPLTRTYGMGCHVTRAA